MFYLFFNHYSPTKAIKPLRHKELQGSDDDTVIISNFIDFFYFLKYRVVCQSHQCHVFFVVD